MNKNLELNLSQMRIVIEGLPKPKIHQSKWSKIPLSIGEYTLTLEYTFILMNVLLIIKITNSKKLSGTHPLKEDSHISRNSILFIHTS